MHSGGAATVADNDDDIFAIEKTTKRLRLSRLNRVSVQVMRYAMRTVASTTASCVYGWCMVYVMKGRGGCFVETELGRFVAQAIEQAPMGQTQNQTQ